MPPQDFLDFRDKLFPASGFQSFQFPEIEILMGFEEALLDHGGQVRSLDHIAKMAGECAAGARAWRHIEKARKERTLRSALHNWLYGSSIPGSTPADTQDEEVVQEFISAYLEAIRDLCLPKTSSRSTSHKINNIPVDLL